MKTSAGLVLVKDNKILLAHPTNAPWKASFSIPKGEVIEGEDILGTACREVREEVGISIPLSLIDTTQRSLYYTKKATGTPYKVVYYFVVNANRLNVPLIFTKDMLQLNEVDYAKFFTKKEAATIMMPKQLPILQSF